MQVKRKNSALFYCIVGSFTALGFEPFGFSPIFIISFALFFANISTYSKSTKKILWHSFLFFLFMHIANLYWLAYPLTLDLKKHFLLIPLALTVIPMYFAILLTIPVLITTRCNGIYAKALIFPATFCIMTYIYGHSSFGFPWVIPAYIWSYHEILMQTISVYGIYGLGLLTMLMSTMLGAAIVFFEQKDSRNTLISIGIFMIITILMLAFGIIRLSCNKLRNTTQIAKIVQCSISQKDKNNHTLSENRLNSYLYLSNSEEKADFLIWPEATIPYLYRENNHELNSILASRLHKGSCLISGTIREDTKTRKIYNSVILINYDGTNIGNYDKRHLVPFGEYIPFRRLIPQRFQSIASDIGDFNIGDVQEPFTVNGLKIYVTICYEAIFPEHFISSYKEADLLINITNDAWFGFSSEPFQHMHIARARTIETGLPMIRATNYGISAIFDGCGRLIEKIPIGRVAAISSAIPLKLSESTFYNQYGDLTFWILCILCILLAITWG